METLRSLIEDLVGRNPAVKKKIAVYEAGKLWPKIIDTQGKSWVGDVSGGVLSVFTENPSFCQELAFGKNKIIKALNDRIGDKAVKDIKVRIGTKRKES